jgi:gliding motility-associated-like protein
MFPNNNSPGFLVVYNTCDANFYDTGGIDSPYNYGENSIATFCPIESEDSIRITFNYFDLQANHLLRIYDGDSDSAPIIGSFSNLFMETQEYEFIASSENSSGCLTVTFNVAELDSVDQPYDGWEADIGCTTCVYPEISKIVDISLCDDGSGSGSINFYDESLLSQITSDQANTIISFYETLQDARTAVNAIQGVYTFDSAKDIYVRVEDIISGCSSFTSFNLKLNELPVSNLLPQYVACLDGDGEFLEDTISLDTNLANSDYSFEWYYEGNLVENVSGSNLEASNLGEYSVLITNNTTNCQIEDFTEVVDSESSVSYQVNIKPSLFARTKSIEIVVSGNGTYIFSLNNTEFNSNGVFENVPSGSHTINITDEDGCVDIEFEIYIFDFPQFFTPNGDGINDYWNIRELNDLGYAEIFIFDRYGKLLSRIDVRQIGWDGTYQGRLMPSSEYWFLVKYEYNNKSKEFKGNFSLIR